MIQGICFRTHPAPEGKGNLTQLSAAADMISNTCLLCKTYHIHEIAFFHSFQMYLYTCVTLDYLDLRACDSACIRCRPSAAPKFKTEATTCLHLAHNSLTHWHKPLHQQIPSNVTIKCKKRPVNDSCMHNIVHVCTLCTLTCQLPSLPVNRYPVPEEPLSF